jgi:hypothetical protein
LPQRNKSTTSRIARGVKGFVALTEGKTTIKPLAKIIQGKKKLNSPILIAGFPGAGLVGSIGYIISKLHLLTSVELPRSELFQWFLSSL